MTKYVIYKSEGTASKKYLQTIYRNSTSVSSDIGDAIEYNDKELAINTSKYLSVREKENYKVMSITTTIEEVID